MKIKVLILGKGYVGGYVYANMANNPAITTLDPYVEYRKAKKQKGNGMDILIPLDSDLKPLAKQTHLHNKKLLDENI